MKILHKILLLILALVALLVLLSLLGGNKGGELVVSDFEIRKGESAWDVGSDLNKKKLINGRMKFLIYVYKEGLQKDLKAGEYKLNSGLSVEEIIRIITEGETIEEEKTVKVTFPEGWTIEQMAGRLDKNGFSGDEFIKLANNPKYFLEKYNFEFLKGIPSKNNLEGYLFPDTYFFNFELENEEIVIKKMLKNFDDKLSQDLRSEIEKDNKNIYEIITMSSILEREVKTKEDRKIVSGIFWNRLEVGQAFQSCATLAFVLGENKKQYSYEDTRIESPYNTYLYPGLPPGPISNPGLDSIMAAIYPTDTDFNYFLNNPETGETIFSRTIDEHNINKVKNGL